MSSGIVEYRDRVISSRTMEMRDTLEELELAVSPVADRDSGTSDSSSGPPGVRLADACILSLSASCSASSIRWSAESMLDPEGVSGKESVQLYWLMLSIAHE
jgi:hypothetical protein